MTETPSLPPLSSAFLLLHHCFSKKVNHLLRTLPLDVSQAHIIAPFNDVLKKIVLAILNSSELEPITWQQINLRIDSGGLGISIDARTSHLPLGSESCI